MKRDETKPDKEISQKYLLDGQINVDFKQAIVLLNHKFTPKNNE